MLALCRAAVTGSGCTLSTAPRSRGCRPGAPPCERRRRRGQRRWSAAAPVSAPGNRPPSAAWPSRSTRRHRRRGRRALQPASTARPRRPAERAEPVLPVRGATGAAGARPAPGPQQGRTLGGDGGGHLGAALVLLRTCGLGERGLSVRVAAVLLVVRARTPRGLPWPKASRRGHQRRRAGGLAVRCRGPVAVTSGMCRRR